MAGKVPGPPVIDSSLEGLKRWQIERQVYQNYYNRGSRYTPFSIEPLPYSVQRTARPMTDEDRFLRKQWLKDQILAADEPRNVPEVKPLNGIRKFYQKPWNAIERSLKTVMTPSAANYVRVVVPKIMLGYLVVLFGYYQTRYNYNTWEKCNGVNVFGKRRIRVGDDTVFPEEPVFGNARFNERDFRKS